MTGETHRKQPQRGVTLLGLLFWSIVIGVATLIGLKAIPAVSEFFTIRRAVEKIALSGASTVSDIRGAFDRQKDIEYAIVTISGKDLEITKVNDKVIIAFAYNKEIELMDPVYLLFKFEGRSK